MIVEIVDPNPPVEEFVNNIIGETFIYPLSSMIYSTTYPINGAAWSVKLTNENKDIDDVLEYEILDDGNIKITWTAMVSGSFEIHYGDLIRTIIVQSLF